MENKRSKWWQSNIVIVVMMVLRDHEDSGNNNVAMTVIVKVKLCTVMITHPVCRGLQCSYPYLGRLHHTICLHVWAPGPYTLLCAASRIQNYKQTTRSTPPSHRPLLHKQTIQLKPNNNLMQTLQYFPDLLEQLKILCVVSYNSRIFPKRKDNLLFCLVPSGFPRSLNNSTGCWCFLCG